MILNRFLVALATRTGSLFNLADLARDLGVSAKRVKAWVSVLEASGQVLTLRPYFTSVGKRLVKRPKVFFLDTGILAYLFGVQSEEQVLQGPAAGPLFEAAVLGQLYRLFIHRGEAPRLSFWRTAASQEVDFLIEDGPRLIPVEAKLTATPSSGHAGSILELQQLLGARCAAGYIVCLCRERLPLARNVAAVPFGDF